MHRSFIGARTARATTLVVVVVLAAAMPAAVLGGVGPSNDNFANATVIVGNLPYSNSTNAAGASREGAKGRRVRKQPQSVVAVYARGFGHLSRRHDRQRLQHERRYLSGDNPGQSGRGHCNDDIDSNDGDLYDSRIAFRATGGTRFTSASRPTIPATRAR